MNKVTQLALSAVMVLSAQVAPAADPAPPGPPPSTYRDPATGMEFVFVKGGCFLMGDVFGEKDGTEPSDERPVHEVCVDDFMIGKYEATQGQWKALMGANPSSGDVCAADDCPVDRVSPADVDEYLRRMSARTPGQRYRLPTEAEWEYAARSGGRLDRYSNGNDIESVSWFGVTTGYHADPQTPPPWGHRVGLKVPNRLGLYDMSGNVYELTADWYDPTYYSRSPRDNPTGPEAGTERVKRGGCAHGDPGNGRTTRRTITVSGDSVTGFRVVKAP